MGRRRDPETAIRRDRVVHLWNEGGKTVAEIALMLGMPYHTAVNHMRIAKGLGRPLRKGSRLPKPETTKLRNAVIDAFNRGNTQAEIADKLALTRGAVGRAIAEARALGIPVVTYSSAETSRRAHVSRRQRLAAVSHAATDN